MLRGAASDPDRNPARRRTDYPVPVQVDRPAVGFQPPA